MYAGNVGISLHVTPDRAMMRLICKRPILAMNGPIRAFNLAWMLVWRTEAGRCVAPVSEDAPVAVDPTTEAPPDPPPIECGTVCPLGELVAFPVRARVSCRSCFGIHCDGKLP